MTLTAYLLLLLAAIAVCALVLYLGRKRPKPPGDDFGGKLDIDEDDHGK